MSERKCDCGRAPGQCVRGDLERCPAWDDDPGTASCPRCMGDRSVNCYCGGDLCVCDNYGEKPCPVCGGEGEVSHERYDRYIKAEAEAMRMWREAMDQTKSEDDPTP